MIDFLVIGGGIAGVSAAARLSELGKVVVLEREKALAYHASGRSAALFEPSYGAPTVKALSAVSRDYHETAHGGVLSPRGLMIVAGADGAEAFARDCAAMGLPDIAVDDALGMVPILDRTRIDRAAYHPDAWDIDTDLQVQNFARELRAHGGQIVLGAEVTDVRKDTNGWVVTAGHTFEARCVVNAAGAWGDPIAEMAGLAPIGLRPLRRSMARIPAPGGHDVTHWPMFFGPGEDWYAKPDAGALLVSPAEEDLQKPHDAWADDMVLAEGSDRYGQYVTERVDRLLSSWAGLRTFAPDRTLVLGPAPQDESFIWCVGQGGYGFQTAPGASQTLADTVAGKVPEVGAEVAAALSPARFA